MPVVDLNVFTWQVSAARVSVEGSPVPTEERVTPTERTGSSACVLSGSGALSARSVSRSPSFGHAVNVGVELRIWLCLKMHTLL